MMNKFRGWKEICRFTYVQTMKSSAMRVTGIIIFLVTLLVIPVMSAVSGLKTGADGAAAAATNIKKVYLFDDTGVIGTHFMSGEITDEIYGDIEYEVYDDNDTEAIKELLAGEEGAVFLEIYYCGETESLNYGVNINVYYDPDGSVDEDEADDYGTFIDDSMRKAILLSAGMDAAYAEHIAKSVTHTVCVLEADGSVSDSYEAQLDMTQYYLTLIFIVVLIFMVSLTGGKVSELIVTEKATRVMEYLLTTVKPMAVLVGKVMGAALVTLTITLAGIAGFVLSLFINNGLFGKLPEKITDMLDSGLIEKPGIGEIAGLLVIIGFGCIFYGIIAGIAGATVSRVEEMAEGMKLFTMVMTIGAYLPLFVTLTKSMSVGAQWSVIDYIIFLLPISSMFIQPPYILMGKMPLAVQLFGILILIVSIVLMMLLVNRIYEQMLYSNGEKMKIGDILKLAGKKRGGSDE